MTSQVVTSEPVTREPVVTSEAVGAAVPRSRDGWRLRRRARQVALVAHLIGAGGWLGIDVVLGVLVLGALLGDPATAAACLQVLPLLFWPLLTAGLLALLSGIVLGLGTRYGLVRYWWVAVKLALNLVLVVLVVVLLRPGLEQAGARGAEGGPDPAAGLGTLAFPPAVSTTAVVVATVLSVVKPWGRVRPRRAPAPGGVPAPPPAGRRASRPGSPR